MAHRIKEWLRTRGLHWPCFCSLTFGGSKSTRIVESLNGRIYAFCNNRSSVCGFRSRFLIFRFLDGLYLLFFSVDLSHIYDTALFESEYDHLPTLRMSFTCLQNVRLFILQLVFLIWVTSAVSFALLRVLSVVNIFVGTVVNTYQSMTGSFSWPELAPRLRNKVNYHQILLVIDSAFWFIGLFPSDFEGARARNQDHLNEEARRLRAAIPHPRPASSAYTRIRRRRNAPAAPSTVRTHGFGELSIREQEVLDRLQAGEGVSGTEMVDLIEKCTSCNQYFIANLLRLHIRACAPDL